MNLILTGLRIPVEKDQPSHYLQIAAKNLQTNPGTLKLVKILAKSLDIKDQEQFYYDISIVVKTADTYINSSSFPVYSEKPVLVRKKIKSKENPVVIGFGPAGMFAALELIEYGLKPLIFERGKKIEDRHADVQKFITNRVLDPESNIQFGEGGAGSYSDGKLFSRIRNSPYIDKVLDTYIKFGAPEEIRYSAKPHIGTDILCKIVANVRNYIIQNGGEIHFSAKLTDIIISGGSIQGIVINGGKEYKSNYVFIAPGHSARDTFEMLHKKGVCIEQKPISVGVRIEHPAETINLLRYGKKYSDFRPIGAAAYSFTYNRITGRNVQTFCMCPGGEVVNASSEQGLLVVNGMSCSARSSEFSNAAIVVTCNIDDYKSKHPLAGLRFQENIEKKAFIAGGKTWKVPAQNLTDFLSGKSSKRLIKNSVKTGTEPADIKEFLPGFLTESLLLAFNSWKEEYPLFVSDNAILIGAETRTSCPLKLKRNENYESVSIKKLFPIGEGSGYTGGITSSAADAIKAVESIIIGTDT
ncbi:MAG: dehydrogenase [Elusimicrobia bacterium]|nr:dehydrogenase [Elusimicrobiota bacterium]